MFTSKSAENSGTTSTSKLLGVPSSADWANFQNLSSWYWGPIREETIGNALNKFMNCSRAVWQKTLSHVSPLERSVGSSRDHEEIGHSCSIAGSL